MYDSLENWIMRMWSSVLEVHVVFSPGELPVVGHVFIYHLIDVSKRYREIPCESRGKLIIIGTFLPFPHSAGNIIS